MALSWWQRLRRSKSPVPNPQSTSPDFGFRISDRPPAGWWLRAESRPVRAGIMAAAKALPALLTAWTHSIPEPEEEPLPRGEERLALLCEWGLEFAA